MQQGRVSRRRKNATDRFNRNTAEVRLAWGILFRPAVARQQGARRASCRLRQSQQKRLIRLGVVIQSNQRPRALIERVRISEEGEAFVFPYLIYDDPDENGTDKRGIPAFTKMELNGYQLIRSYPGLDCYLF